MPNFPFSGIPVNMMKEIQEIVKNVVTDVKQNQVSTHKWKLCIFNYPTEVEKFFNVNEIKDCKVINFRDQIMIFYLS